jgi:hypothetical protein
MDKISMWMGKPIEKLTKTELIAALTWVCNELESESKEHVRQLDVLLTTEERKKRFMIIPRYYPTE